MKLLLITFSLIASTAFADTAIFKVGGMHCSGCKNMITKDVCKNEKVNVDFESCEVKLIDKKAQTGEVIVTAKKDKKIDQDAVTKAIMAVGTGEDYKVLKTETK